MTINRQPILFIEFKCFGNVFLDADLLQCYQVVDMYILIHFTNVEIVKRYELTAIMYEQWNNPT